MVSTAKYFVPMLLVRFGKLLPGIDVTLSIDNRENILGMLSRNEVDLVIMGRAPHNLDCEATAFATNPMGIVCAPDHPLSRRKRVQFVMRQELLTRASELDVAPDRLDQRHGDDGRRAARRPHGRRRRR